MSTSTLIAIYFLIWWVTLFAVLPWGVRNQEESGEVIPGTDPGAPANAPCLAKARLDDGGRHGDFRSSVYALFAQSYSIRLADDDFRPARR